MRPLSPEERWALDILAGPPSTFNGSDGGIGQRLDSQFPSLIERGLLVWHKDGRGGVWVSLSDLGRLAQRLPIVSPVAPA